VIRAKITSPSSNDVYPFDTSIRGFDS
jgi:hypothetical protein